VSAGRLWRRFAAWVVVVMLLIPSIIPAGTTPFTFINVGARGADFDSDGRVGFADFLLFVANYNIISPDPRYDSRYDLDSDGAVGFGDFLTFSAVFGKKAAQPAATDSDDTLFQVYVVDPPDNSIVGFDYTSHLITDYMPFRGPTALRVSEDQESIFVSEVFGFFVLNNDHTVRFSVPTSSAGRIAISPDGATAYVTEQFLGRVLVIDLAAQMAVDTLALDSPPSEISLSADGQILYVGSQLRRDITVVSTDPLQVVESVQTGFTPGEILASPDGSRIYVSHLDDGSLAILDGQTHQLTGTIQLSAQSSLGLAFSPDAGILYITASASIMALDTQTNLMLNTLVLGDATSTLGVAPDGRRAYVGTLAIDEGGTGITVVDLETFSVLGRMRGFQFPVQIGFRRLGGAAAKPLAYFR